MSQSLSKLYVHIVFHTKNNKIKIRKEDRRELYAYMGAIIKDNNSLPIIINGVEDHVDVFCVMSKNIALSKLVEEIKRHSSRWIKTRNSHYDQFYWQGGYGGFSVSPSLYAKTRDYIKNQELHHKKSSFKEEYLLLLKEYGIDYDENYLWTESIKLPFQGASYYFLLTQGAAFGLCNPSFQPVNQPFLTVIVVIVFLSIQFI